MENKQNIFDLLDSSKSNQEKLIDIWNHFFEVCTDFFNQMYYNASIDLEYDAI